MLENVLPAWEERIRKDERTIIENQLSAWEEKIRTDAEKKGRNKEKHEIAKNMLDIGLTIEQILQATGLTKEDILTLKN